MPAADTVSAFRPGAASCALAYRESTQSGRVVRSVSAWKIAAVSNTPSCPGGVHWFSWRPPEAISRSTMRRRTPRRWSPIYATRNINHAVCRPFVSGEDSRTLQPFPWPCRTCAPKWDHDPPDLARQATSCAASAQPSQAASLSLSSRNAAMIVPIAPGLAYKFLSPGIPHVSRRVRQEEPSSGSVNSTAARLTSHFALLTDNAGSRSPN